MIRVPIVFMLGAPLAEFISSANSSGTRRTQLSWAAHDVHSVPSPDRRDVRLHVLPRWFQHASTANPEQTRGASPALGTGAASITAGWLTGSSASALAGGATLGVVERVGGDPAAVAGPLERARAGLADRRIAALPPGDRAQRGAVISKKAAQIHSIVDYGL